MTQVRRKPKSIAFKAPLMTLVLLAAACAPRPLQAQRDAPPAADAAARPGLLARLPDGRRLNFRCSGQGKPTVILEGGYAATSLAWSQVQPLIAKTNRVCAYDRAGLGFSDPGPFPRDGGAIARDLDHGLRAARIPGPYVLVGHSAGGLYARIFSNRRPDDVVGMVLLETSVEQQDVRFASVFGPGAGSIEPMRQRDLACQAAAEKHLLPSEDPDLARCVPADRAGLPASVNAARRTEALRPTTWSTQASELETLWGATSDELIRGRQSYGDLPLIVLTGADSYAEISEPARGAVRQFWSQLHWEVAGRSLRGEARLVERSGHMMLLDRPDTVAAAVQEVVAAGQERPGNRR